MSYSFTVKATTKDEAKAAVEKYFDEQVIAPQPVHARDRAAVLANANAVIDLLADDETKDIKVSCHGSVGWSDSSDSTQISVTSVMISSNAFHVIRE